MDRAASPSRRPRNFGNENPPGAEGRRARGLRRQRAAAARWGRGRGGCVWGGNAAPARGLARPRAPACRAAGARLGASPRRRRPAVPGGQRAERQPWGVKGKWPGGGNAGAQVPRRAGPAARPSPRVPRSRPPSPRGPAPRARSGPGREPAAGPGGAPPARRSELRRAEAAAERLAAAATGCFGPAWWSALGLPSAARAGRGLAGSPLLDPSRACCSGGP